jgi:hypothetical protein
MVDKTKASNRVQSGRAIRAGGARQRGSVPAVKRAVAEGEIGRANVRRKVAELSRGTEGSRLKRDNRARGLRGPGNQ